MLPSTSLGSWWMAHLQLPGYDPIATAGACRFDIRAAEQALVFCTQALHLLLSPWEEAILLNLWGWRHADGRRRYVTVYAEPYRHDALAVWCATLALWLLRAAPPRRAPQVVVAYAQAALAADVYQQVAAALTGEFTLRGAFLLDPGPQAVGTPTGGRLTLVHASTLLPGEVLLRREDGQPLALAVATRDAEHSPTVAPMAEAARQALAGETGSVLPARM
jgi:hypothetical protein